MSGNILWKFLLTVGLIAWCIGSIVPLKDRPFEDFIVTEATADADEFAAIMERAQARVANEESQSLFVALRDIGKAEKIDYSKFFPQPHNRVKDIANLEKRNDVLLKHLLKSAQSQLRLGLDLKGGVSATLAVADSALAGKSQAEQNEQLSKAITIMSDRLNGSGVAEPVIRARGSSAIEIQMPGVSIKDNPEIMEELVKPARLEFRRVHSTQSPSSNTDTPPPGYELLAEERETKSGEVYDNLLFVKRIPEATGEIIESAIPTQNQSGGFEVALKMTSDGAKVLRTVTEKMVGEPLAIVLDGKLYSAPTVQAVLSSRAQITGQYSQREAFDLANVLNNPLALPLQVQELAEVGPSMAKGAKDSSISAVRLGAILVIAFMVAYYFIGGVVAVISALINVVIVLGVLASLGATLTLPGVAALVLTLGMGVDANILIFERLREELKSGKSIKNATSAAFQKVTSTIVDANITTLITASILIWLGTGPVKGFGYTLAIGICASIFCALVVTRFMVDFLVYRAGMSKVLGINLGGQTKIDFFKFRKPAFIASWTIVLLGVASVVLHHDNILGIDFTGGDEITVEFKEKIDEGDIVQYAQDNGLGEVNPVYQTLIGANQEVLKIQTKFDAAREIVLPALQVGFPQAEFEETGFSQIGGSVSSDIQWNAVWSVLAALGGILLYVAFRFEVGYGIGAVVATIHDVLMTVGIFVLFGEFGLFVSGQFTAPMLASILMIVGYSINDTIVVFDRIREELELNPGAGLRHIINVAISRVFSRSLLTSITTLLAACSLYIFGAGVIKDFSFVFIIGILTGTFSSIFIASPVFYWWHKGDRRHVEERQLTPKRYEWEATNADKA